MLNVENSLLLIIDLQEKLVEATFAQSAVKAAEKLLKAANIMGIPAVVSEQYPRGLGRSVQEIVQNLNDEARIIEKTAFSLLKEDGAKETIEVFGKKQIMLLGIEAHVCVYQTAMDLIKEGYEVHLIKDACKSRNCFEFETGINLMRDSGVKITAVEIALFELLENSMNPHFKEVQSLIK